MPEEGSPAPDFTLPASNGETVTLSLLKGRKVVLYFYPKDSTPGCTREACDFKDNFDSFNKKNVLILGVSKDSLESHNKFINKNELPFLLLSDTEVDVAKAYGVWKEKVNYGKRYMGIERTTFLIDPDGIITKVFKKVKVDGHAGKILELL